MTSITAGKTKTEGKTKIRLWAVLFWLFLWELAARTIGQEILLVSPVKVVLRFFELAATGGYWRSVAYSFFHIIGGFFLALCVGVLLAACSAASLFARELAAPVMAMIKATPVASFVILVLLWVSSKNLSVVIAFLMVLPVVYTNVLEGMNRRDQGLKEMAQIFRIPFFRRLKYLYVPQVMPFFRTACSLSLGLCWKAGVAAEVIGIPDGSIGERLYEAKIYLETPDLFAWTLTVILLSVGFEKCFLFFIKKLAERIR